MTTFHSNRQHFVCKSKVKYTNLKSVERAVKALSEGYKTKFTYYRCGTSNHYHLTHENPAERIGRGNKLKESKDDKDS